MKPLTLHYQDSLTDATSDRQVITMWLAGKSTGTVGTYTSTIKQFLEVVGVGLKGMKLDHFYAYLQWLESVRDYSPTTIQNKLTIAKSLISFAAKVGYIKFNLGVVVKTKPARDSINERILDKSDVAKLLSVISSQRDLALVGMMFFCGLRVSEVVGLKWSDLIVRGDCCQVTVYGKGGRTRFVLVPGELSRDLLQLYRPYADYIFISRTGKPLERTMVHKLVKKYAAAAGINPDVSCHWLRHTHATEALANGADIKLVQESLGHSSLATTSRYLHCRPQEHTSQFVKL